MLLSTNLYFDIKIGSVSDFLDFKDLINFKMIETAGVELPTFELSFRTTNTSIKDKIVENNPIVVKIGTDKTNSDSFTISILSKKIEENASGYYTCFIFGYLSNKRFLLDKVIRAVYGTSLDGIKTVGAEYLTQVDTDIYQVNEKPQNWIITNHSNQKLITDMWLHMHMYPSFPLIGISRYGHIVLKDFIKLKQSQPKYIFTQKKSTQSANEIIYLNNFQVDNYTHVYNLYAGYGKVVNILNQNTGKHKVHVNEVDPNNLAASQEVEITQSGNRVFDGYSVSDNVHENFHNAYFYNTSKLLQLSNLCGFLEFKGIYKRDLHILDLVSVQPIDSEKNSTLSGRYVVNTIEYSLTSQTPFSTKVYVCRDSLNNIENNIITPNQTVKIPAKTKQDLLEDAKLAQRSMAVLRAYLAGYLVTDLRSYLTSLKYGVINSFSINGNKLNLASQLSLTNRLEGMGRNLLVQILGQFLPSEILTLFQSQGWGNNPNLIGLLSQLVNQYAPAKYAGFYHDLVLTINSINTKLESISTFLSNQAIANSSANLSYTGSNSMLINTNSFSSDNVNNVVNNIVNNAKGLDIPIPIITLSESQSILNNTQLTDHIVDQTIDHLTSLGYLKNIDISNFKNILLGNTLLDSNTITQINSNIGKDMYIRHWGSFNDLSDLTQFYVRKSYEDKFKTLNCIKTIDARGGKCIFIALPTIKSNLKFYINSIETEMSTTPISLNYFDSYGSNTPYTIYYTTQRFNSNSILFEVRQA
jgi:hypothetical protein